MSENHNPLLGGWFQIVVGPKTLVSSSEQLEAVIPQELTREASQAVLDAVINQYNKGYYLGMRDAQRKMREALGVLEP
jgi:hypothetical protein